MAITSLTLEPGTGLKGYAFDTHLKDTDTHVPFSGLLGQVAATRWASSLGPEPFCPGAPAPSTGALQTQAAAGNLIRPVYEATQSRINTRMMPLILVAFRSQEPV